MSNVQDLMHRQKEQQESLWANFWLEKVVNICEMIEFTSLLVKFGGWRPPNVMFYDLASVKLTLKIPQP